MKSDSQVHITHKEGNKSSALSYHMMVETLIKKFPRFDSVFPDSQSKDPIETVRAIFNDMAYKLELCHQALGVATEANEVADVLKAHAIYGKELDRDALIKELGDLRFWIMDIQNKHHIGDQEIVQGNADKLSERYFKVTGGYTDKAAITRVDKKYVIARNADEFAKGVWLAGPFEHMYEAEARANSYIDCVSIYSTESELVHPMTDCVVPLPEINVAGVADNSTDGIPSSLLKAGELLSDANCNGMPGQDHIPYRSIPAGVDRCARCGLIFPDSYLQTK